MEAKKPLPLTPNELMDLRIEAESFIRDGMRSEVASYAEVGAKLHGKGITLRKLRNVDHAEVSAASLLKDDKALKAWARKALSVRLFVSWCKGLNRTWERATLAMASLIGSHKLAWTETGNISDAGQAALKVAIAEGSTLEAVRDALGIVKGAGRKVTLEGLLSDAGKLPIDEVALLTLTLGKALGDVALADTLKALAVEVKRRKAAPPVEAAPPVVEVAKVA